MGVYGDLAIDLLESAFGDRYVRDDTRILSFGPDAGTGEVDGTIEGHAAVEFAVGPGKQIRASVLDLAFHRLSCSGWKRGETWRRWPGSWPR
jgi:hypothetical protein